MTGAILDVGIVLYSTAIELARRLAGPVAVVTGKKKAWNLDERQKMPRIVSPHRSKTMVWVHAASLGEAKLLLQFLETLERRNPGDSYVVTATTRSGVDYLERMRRPSIHAIGFLPLDTIALMKSLITRFSVSRLWLLETELWPGMLWTCRRRGVPVCIVNARIEEKSFANYRRFKAVFGALLRETEMVLAQNETYARRFLELGVRPDRLHIVGNIKGHIQVRRPPLNERLSLRRRLLIDENAVVITAGCFHKGEGEVARRCIDALAGKGRACKCIVVPRRLDESSSLAGELGGAARLTECEARSPWELCIIEKLGILEAMYTIADVAVVGGTFVNIGGHNVWEAARFGIPVFFGPHYDSQQSSCEKLLAAGVGFMVRGPGELARGIEKILWTEPKKFAGAAALFAESTNRTQRILEPLIP